jgi:hypothetical protein
MKTVRYLPFLFVVFLFGLPLILGKLQAFVLGDTRLNVCFEVWPNVTCSFMWSKIEVWHSRFWCYCVFKIVLEKSSRLTTWGSGNWTPWWSMLPIAPFFFFVPPKMLWKCSYHDHEEGGAPASCYSQYFFCILVILFRCYFQVHNISFGNAPLIFFASSFQSFATMSCLQYSQCVSCHKSIIISNLASVHSLPSTWGL